MPQTVVLQILFFLFLQKICLHTVYSKPDILFLSIINFRFFGILWFVMANQHSDCCKNQKHSENINYPTELVDECHTENNHHCSENYSTQYTIKQNFMLIFFRNG